MRSGLLPGQQRELRRAIKKARAFDRFRSRTRRSFLGVVVAGFTGAAASFWAGTRVTVAEASDARPSRPDTLGGPLAGKLPVAHAFASAPDDALRANAALFLVILDAHGGDDVLWTGFARLCRMAEASTSERDRLLAQRLLASADRLTAPAFAQPWIAKIRARIQGR